MLLAEGHDNNVYRLWVLLTIELEDAHIMDSSSKATVSFPSFTRYCPWEGRFLFLQNWWIQNRCRSVFISGYKAYVIFFEVLTYVLRSSNASGNVADPISTVSRLPVKISSILFRSISVVPTKAAAASSISITGLIWALLHLNPKTYGRCVEHSTSIDNLEKLAIRSDWIGAVSAHEYSF